MKNPLKGFFKKPRKFSFRNSLKTRSVKIGTYSAAITAFVIAIAVFVNLMVSKLPATATQLDTTDQSLYTLSQQTKDIVSSLSDDVTVYWVVSAGSESAELQKFLARYTALSSHLTVVEKDPVVNPTFTNQYTDDQLSSNSLIVVCGDRVKTVDYNDIYVMDYYSYYTTGSTSYTFEGEGAVTGAISYVTAENLSTVYTLEGHGETDLSSTFQKDIENENMTISSLNLISEGSVPEDCDTLLIVSPQTDLSTEETTAIETYLSQGGSLYLITDYVDSTLTNLTSLMNDRYGITLNDGVVIEGDSNHCVSGYSHYLLPDIGSHDITSPFSGGSYHVIMPLAQGLTVPDTLPDGVSVTKLLTTSDSAFSKIDLQSQNLYEKEDGDIDGGFALGVAITEDCDNGETSKVVWLTSSSLMDDQTNEMSSGTDEDLLVNAIGYLCDSEQTISIHGKSLDSSFLTIPSGTASLLAVLLMGFLPAACLITGIVITVRRKRRV